MKKKKNIKKEKKKERKRNMMMEKLIKKNLDSLQYWLMVLIKPFKSTYNF